MNQKQNSTKIKFPDKDLETYRSAVLPEYAVEALAHVATGSIVKTKPEIALPSPVELPSVSGNSPIASAGAPKPYEVA